MQVEHLECRKLEDVVGDGGDLVEAEPKQVGSVNNAFINRYSWLVGIPEVKPGNVFRELDHVQGHPVEAASVCQVVVSQSDHIGIVPKKIMPQYPSSSLY